MVRHGGSSDISSVDRLSLNFFLSYVAIRERNTLKGHPLDALSLPHIDAVEAVWSSGI